MKNASLGKINQGITEFQKKVFEKLNKVPSGRVTSYKEIARALGNEKLARAVARALSRNPYPHLYKCYKVIREDKSIGGYSLGVEKKKELLRKEGIIIKGDKIVGDIYRFKEEEKNEGNNNFSR